LSGAKHLRLVVGREVTASAFEESLHGREDSLFVKVDSLFLCDVVGLAVGAVEVEE
jgi:hypothetical protein